MSADLDEAREQGLRDELKATRAKLAESKKRVQHLEKALKKKKTKSVEELQRHARALADDVSTAVARQAQAERERDEALALVNQAKHDAAKFYRKAIVALFRAMGLDEKPCKSCGRTIWFVKTKNGKPAPYTLDGVSHFADCPGAKKHRKAR